METLSWNRVIHYYTNVSPRDDAGSAMVAMDKLVREIADSRYAIALHPTVSHNALLLFAHAHFSDVSLM